MNDIPTMRCGNDPRTVLTPGDRKAVEEFREYLAARRFVERYLGADKPRPDRDRLASHLWKACAHDVDGGVIADDPRTIAAAALTWPGWNPVGAPPVDVNGARLLDCGLCYEENGEEVHPYPECTATAEESAPSRSVDEPPAAPGADEPRPWRDLRDSGLLWLINRAVLHPRGVALALHADNAGNPYGWSLRVGDDRTPWTFDATTDALGFDRAEATLAAARDQTARSPEDQGAAAPVDVAAAMSGDTAEAESAGRELEEQNEQLGQALDGAYQERAALLAWIAAGLPGDDALLIPAPAPDAADGDDSWAILCMRVLGYQLTWHINPRDFELFRDVAWTVPDDQRVHWDGHSRSEKYARIRGIVGELVALRTGRIVSRSGLEEV